MANEYRIVRDAYLGFEVQVRRWWWPFWSQCNFINTHSSLERAEQFARDHAAGIADIVKYLGKLERSPLTPEKG